MEVGLRGGLKTLAAGVQALHVGEDREDEAPASVYLGDDEDVPERGVVVPDLAPRDAAPEVCRGGVINVLAGDGPAARGGVFAKDAELRLRVSGPCPLWTRGRRGRLSSGHSVLSCRS